MKHFTLVREVMTHEILAVMPKTTADVAYEMMAEAGCRHLPVLDGDKLEGILSDRDILLFSGWREGKIFVPKVAVDTVMSRFPLTCRPDTKLADVAWIMAEQKLDAMPVTDFRGRVIGIVTSTDLVKTFMNEGEENHGLGRFIPMSPSLYPLVVAS